MEGLALIYPPVSHEVSFQILVRVSRRVLLGFLKPAFEEFPGHEVLKFPDKADWAFSFMFNLFGLA